MSASWISSKITVRDSSIEGIGSFANAPIAQGEIVIIQGGQIVQNEKLLRDPFFQPFAYHCFQVEGDFHICPLEPNKEALDGVFHVNHSCEPTCGFRGQISVVALRDIIPGEEITYDYAMTDAHWTSMQVAPMQCCCGSSMCRKAVAGNDWQRPELQLKYHGYFSRYIQELIDAKGTLTVHTGDDNFTR